MWWFIGLVAAAIIAIGVAVRMEQKRDRKPPSGLQGGWDREREERDSPGPKEVE